MRLFINGDDFGMNRSCSRAIAEALCAGLIDGATMMANGEYFDGAVKLMTRDGFSGKIGVHFNLTEGRPLTAAIAKCETFVKNGFFHKDYLRSPHPLTNEEQAAVYAELSAQVTRLKRAGINVTRADSHHYIHTFEYLAPLAASVCKEHGIKQIRLNRTFDTPERPAITKDRISNKFWRENGFTTTDNFGRLSDLRSGIVSGRTEIMVHPDYDKNGVLIDRTGYCDGFPKGDSLSVINDIKQKITGGSYEGINY